MEPILQNISWNIRDDPQKALLMQGGQLIPIPTKLKQKYIFPARSIIITYSIGPIGYEVDMTYELTAPITLDDLLFTLYTFYQSELTAEDITALIEEGLIDSNSTKPIRAIDVMGTMTNFEGLQKYWSGKDLPTYEVLLG